MTHADILALLEKELVVALGCTEPAAVAYAAALAARAAGGEPRSVEVEASANVIKNAMAVGIPGTPFTGMSYAAALGAAGGDPERRLAVLAGLDAAAIGLAARLVEAGAVKVRRAETPKKLFVEVLVRGAAGEGRARIEDEHDRVTLVSGPRAPAAGKAAPASDGSAASLPEAASVASAAPAGRLDLDIPGVFAFAETVELSRLGIIRRAIELNAEISREGLSGDYGLRVGKLIRENVEAGILADDLLNAAMSKAAAGSDARMAGSPLPVMSNSGSGNQGIAATLPVLAVGERLGAPEEKILRAVTLSNLMTVYIKSKFGRLSGLCGAVVAGTGSACGIAYLLGGGLPEVKSAIQNMIGNVSGMLCDGAKGDCALKISTCTAAAVQAALMARRGISVTQVEGIVDADPEKSIENLARLGNEGSPALDEIVLDVMVSKGGQA